MKTYKGDLNKENMPENGIFTFGSNTVSINGNPYRGTGGAALIAHLEFGDSSKRKHDKLLFREQKSILISYSYSTKNIYNKCNFS